jgi:hypothetical protein
MKVEDKPAGAREARHPANGLAHLPGRPVRQ